MPSPPNENQISNYFAALGAALARMPAAQRNAQVQELNQHLEALIVSLTTQGQSLDEATAHALTQMGDPTTTGRRLMREWQTSRNGTFAHQVIAVLLGTGIFLYALVIDIQYNVLQSPLELIVKWGTPILGGFAVGILFPKFAVRGIVYVVTTAFVLILLTLVTPMLLGQTPQTVALTSNYPTRMAEVYVQRVVPNVIVYWYLVGIVTAFIASRLTLRARNIQLQ